MKLKKILAVLLAAGMTLGTVTMSGCSKKTNNDESEESGVVVLNMYVITEPETSEKAAKEVQKAINEITVPNDKLLVKINYVTADEYYDVLAAAEEEVGAYAKTKGIDADAIAALEGVEEAEGEGEEAEEAADGEEKTVTPEEADAAIEAAVDGMPVTGGKHFSQMSFNEVIDYVFSMDDVELEKPQLDVVVINDYDVFMQMVEDGKLAEIDTKYDRKTITKYLHPTMLATTTVNKKVYGIPTNCAMGGTYKFLVFNKNLLDKYGYTVSDLRKVEDMGEYLSLVKAGEPSYYPINDIPGMAGVEIYDNILYSQSALTTVSSAAFPLYMNNTAYVAYLNAAAEYRANGYVAAADGVTDAKYAVEYVESADLLDHEWTDEDGNTYQAYLYDIPRVGAKEIFKSAMCVSSLSLNRAKAAKLVELFNIDPELCNLLTYGIEGVHYRLEDGIVSFIETNAEDTYRMNPLYTGNTYIQYTTEGNEEYIAKSKSSNLSSAPSSFFGYEVSFDDAANESVFECVKLFSAEALELVNQGKMTVAEVFNIASKQLNALGCMYNADGTALLGIFGKLSTQVANNNTELVANFRLNEDAKTYNDVYKTRDELAAEEAEAAAEIAAEKAEKEAADAAALDARIAAENRAAEEAKAAEEEADPNAEEEEA